MGVPSFFCWITKKYPQIVEDATPNSPTDVLHIDFNALIHISCAPADGPTPKTENQMMSNIEKNMDRIVEKCRPQKLIVISTDGVAPRAKLNQQRARRYRSIIETLELNKKDTPEPQRKKTVTQTNKTAEKTINTSCVENEYKVDFVGLMDDSASTDEYKVNESFREEPESNSGAGIDDNNTTTKSIHDIEKDTHNNVGAEDSICDIAGRQSMSSNEIADALDEPISDLFEESSLIENEMFDKNAITPGTRFMHDLEDKIDVFLKDRLKNDPRYKRLYVIYSNGRRAGEGEQKIMEIIRKMKNKNLRHTIFSPDADVILLGASLHGYNVKIMRDDLDFTNSQKKNTCENCGKKGHLNTYCNNLVLFSCIFLNINILRRSLFDEFSSMIHGQFELSRMIDDWILMSFLAGNDFLPTLPCFDVRFKAIEILTKLLTENYNRTRKYITYRGEIDFSVLHSFFRILARHEDHLYANKKRLLNIARRRFQTKEHYESIPLETVYGKTKYYDVKLHLKSEREVIMVCREYILGLSWIFRYYTKGVTNWEWFYPHDYAPFACDLANVKTMPYLHGKTEPLDCLQQQLLVMPPQSRNLVPKEMHPIFDGFPTTVEIDMFDKLMPWCGVTILPIIDIEALLCQVKDKRKLIAYEDAIFGVDSKDLLYINNENKLFVPLRNIYNERMSYINIFIEFNVRAVPYYKHDMNDSNIVVMCIQYI